MQVHCHTRVRICKPPSAPLNRCDGGQGRESSESKKKTEGTEPRSATTTKLLSLVRNAIASGLQDELSFHNAASAPVIFYFVPPSLLGMVIGEGES